MVPKPGQGQSAEEHIEQERPVIAHREGDQAERPEEVGHRGGLRFDDLPDLVDLMRKRRMGDPHPQLGAGESRGDGTDLEARVRLPEDPVVLPLELQDLRDRFQEELRAQPVQPGG